MFVSMEKLSPLGPKTEFLSHGETEISGPFKLRDRVVFCNKYNQRLKGTVRWIGSNNSVLPDGTNIMGIEAVSDHNMHLVYDKYTPHVARLSCIMFM